MKRKNVYIDENAFVSEDAVIGDNSKIWINSQIREGVHIGKNCIRDTLIKQGASICANATIICGNVIGEYAMVAAGSVVTHDVEPYSLVAGNPARCIGHICKCGRKTEGNTCPNCGFKIPI